MGTPIHFCVPVMGALLFLAYYSQYASTEDSKKLKMILEITTTFFPLLISVIVGLNVTLEEKASHFQTLLAVPNRHKNMLAKLTYLYGSGVFALSLIHIFFRKLWNIQNARMVVDSKVNTLHHATVY